MDEKKTEVSIKVSAPYDADSCEGVLAICSWIKEAVCKCGIEIKSEEYSFRCSFKAGDISYDCYSVDEFKKHAFGQKIIVYTCYLVVYHDNDKIYFGISDKAWREDNIYVSCNDKLLLLDLKTFLLKEKSILSDQSEGHISINAVNSIDLAILQNHILQKIPHLINHSFRMRNLCFFPKLKQPRIKLIAQFHFNRNGEMLIVNL